MIIEVTAPASLTLGLVKMEQAGRQTQGRLGLSLQQPPVNLAAQPAAGLSITGPRADLAHRHAQSFFEHHGREPRGQVEIELAIARGMGLGSQPALALATARALAWANDLPHEDAAALGDACGLGREHGLALRAFDQGGLLLVEDEPARQDGWPAVLRRQEIAHEDKAAWVFVFYLPLTEAGTPANLEASRLAAMRAAAPHLSAETGRLLEEQLWPAAEQDDLPAFASALMDIMTLNRQALEQAGQRPPLTADEEELLALMRDNGALAWGKAPTGLAYFGLLRGASASIALRARLNERVGLFAGTVMAGITDNSGARHVLKDEDLQDAKARPPRLMT